MANDRLSDQDIERVSQRVAGKIAGYAAKGLLIAFGVFVLLLWFLGAFTLPGFGR